MMTKLTVIGCLILTAVVVVTALRIEQLNSQSGMFLPRPSNEPWQVASLDQVHAYIDSQIAIRRSGLFSVEHPDEAIPAPESFVGAPYTAGEQAWFDRSTVEHSALSRLRWWVISFGAAQYLIAPIALFWAATNFLAIRKTPHRISSGLCALLAFAAIFLMVFRGY